MDTTMRETRHNRTTILGTVLATLMLLPTQASACVQGLVEAIVIGFVCVVMPLLVVFVGQVVMLIQVNRRPRSRRIRRWNRNFALLGLVASVVTFGLSPVWALLPFTFSLAGLWFWMKR